MGKYENINAKRERNKEIFNESLMIITDTPALNDMQKIAIRETRAISPIKSDEYLSWEKLVLEQKVNSKDEKMCTIKVTRNRTFEAVRKGRVFDDGSKHIAVLNFASATTPGGGVLSGSSAQEESLCRVSTLYQSLTSKNAKIYYEMNRRHKDRYYTDWIIYTPDVVVFRNDDFEDMSVLPIEKWYDCNVITCPAPNMRQQVKNRFNPDDNIGVISPNATREYKEIMKNRIRRILAIAERMRNTHLILGAFGCGAFMNDPKIVSELFKEVIIDEGFGYLFEYIEFAIYCRPYNALNNEIFYKTFKPYMK